jgi:hypothetical protein
MSIKRTKQVTRGGRFRDAEPGSTGLFGAAKPKAEEQVWNWQEQVGAKPDDAFVPYAQTNTFQKEALILHPTFGKGIVTGVDGKRISVLFQDGVKKLGHAS